jgi:hypothetical protein
MFKKSGKLRIILTLIFVSAQSSIAQACIFPPSVEEKFNKSDIVFVGVANHCDSKKNLLTFDVKGIWKGDYAARKQITVRKCPYVDLGKEYLVYAKAESDTLRTLHETTFCPGDILPVSIDSEEMNAEQDLKKLGKPKQIH